MKTIFTLLLFSLTVIGYAQTENVFLDRDFWKKQPDVSEIKAMILKGNDPAAKDQFAFDGVSYAIIDNAPIESIKYMLSLEGNPVTKKTHGSVSYLLWSAYKGNKDVMEHLLSLGADPKMSTSSGTNMLLMAAIGGVENPLVYDLILEQGIATDYQNERGANALHLLSGSEISDLSIFDYFLSRGIPLDVTDKDGNNLFNYAARGGDIKIMEYWKNKGVSYDKINAKGENAAVFASSGMKRRTLRLDVFEYLSEELGLEIDLVNREGKTPLHLAGRRGTPELLEFFLEKGVSAAQIDHEGNTALHFAASGKKENMAVLLAAIHNINLQNDEGLSPLMAAVKRNSVESINFLITNGADIGVTDHKGNDLFYYAFSYYREGKQMVTTHILDEMLKKGESPKRHYENGNTLVHIAIEKESKFLLEKALSYGLDVNHKNFTGLTALHLAAMKAKNKELLKVLLKNGAQKELRTDQNESAYDLAMENELLEKRDLDMGFLRID